MKICLACILLLAGSAAANVAGSEGGTSEEQFDSLSELWACEPTILPSGSLNPCLEEITFDDGHEDLLKQDVAFWFDFTTAFMEDVRRDPLHKARGESGGPVNTTKDRSPLSSTDVTVLGTAVRDELEGLESQDDSQFWTEYANAFMQHKLQNPLHEARAENRTVIGTRKASSLRCSAFVTVVVILGALISLVFTLTAKVKHLHQRCAMLEKDTATWLFDDHPGKAGSENRFIQELHALNARHRDDLLARDQQYEALRRNNQLEVRQLQETLAFAQMQREDFRYKLSKLSAWEERRRAPAQSLPSTEAAPQCSAAELQQLRCRAVVAEVRAREAEEALRLQTEAAEHNLLERKKAEAELRATQQLLEEATRAQQTLQGQVVGLTTKLAETQGKLESRNMQNALLKADTRGLLAVTSSLTHVKVKHATSKRLAKGALPAGLAAKGRGLRDGRVDPAVTECGMEVDAPQALAAGNCEMESGMDSDPPAAEAAADADVPCEMEVDAPARAPPSLQLAPPPIVRGASCEMTQADPLPERTILVDMVQADDLYDISANQEAVAITAAGVSPPTQQAHEPGFAAPGPEPGNEAPAPEPRYHAAASEPRYCAPAPEPRYAPSAPLPFPTTAPLLLPAPLQCSGPPSPPSPPVPDATCPTMSQSSDIRPAEETGLTPPNLPTDLQGATRGPAQQARRVRREKRLAQRQASGDVDRARRGPATESFAGPSETVPEPRTPGGRRGKRRADGTADGDLERAMMGPAEESPSPGTQRVPARKPILGRQPEFTNGASTPAEPLMPQNNITVLAPVNSEEDCLPEPPRAGESRARNTCKPRLRRTDFSKLSGF